MGDLIQLTTWPSNRNIFYRISSSGFKFDVKGDDGAVIGLSKKIGNTCDYWVVIGKNHQTWIRKEGSSGKSVRTPQIISSQEYRKFWLTWRNGNIILGRFDIRGVILCYNYETEINYVTFGVSDSIGAGVIHWRFESSPTRAPPGFPPYAPYESTPAPPSVADTIIAGRDLRVQHKSVLPRHPVRPPPKPAKPRGPKATDVKLNRRAMRAHARCLRRHGAVLTDRLECMAKPQRRNIIYLLREFAYRLPPETIARLRSMLDADEPFKPDQAYEYFINLRKTNKKNTKRRNINQIKKDVLAMCTDKRFVWARNATVTFAKGIQQRLSRPGRYVLADRMLRLSNIILDDMCNYMHTRTPSRRCMHPKAKFMIEMADKIAVWIDEVLAESDDHMLMMDFDEDEEVEQSVAEADRPVTPTTPQTPTPESTLGATPAATPAQTATPGTTPASSKTSLSK